MRTFVARASKNVRGTITVGPDKSLSHRALILSALASGASRISNLLCSGDVLCTADILTHLGISITPSPKGHGAAGEITVSGKGLQGLSPAPNILYCGNSGTTMRLMLGLLAAQPFSSRLTGDDSLNRRPMERVMIPLEKMGAHFDVAHEGGKRVIAVNPRLAMGGKGIPLQAIDYRLPVASAQVKSALLLAGLSARGKTRLIEPEASRNHTEVLLKNMGADISATGFSVVLSPSQNLKPLIISIPGDFSSAAFFVAAALLVPGSDLTIKNVGLNPTRTGFLDVLKNMGASVHVVHRKTVSGEEVGDIHVRHSQLTNVSVGGSLVPRLIDEIPLLALVGCFAAGEMPVSGASELRHKETDRIRAVCSELVRLGAGMQERKDGFIVQGGLKVLRPVSFPLTLKSYGDHRMAMMEAVAGLVSDKPFEIDDVSCVNTSFPGFFKILQKVAWQDDSV